MCGTARRCLLAGRRTVLRQTIPFHFEGRCLVWSAKWVRTFNHVLRLAICEVGILQDLVHLSVRLLRYFGRRCVARGLSFSLSTSPFRCQDLLTRR